MFGDMVVDRLGGHSRHCSFPLVAVFVVMVGTCGDLALAENDCLGPVPAMAGPPSLATAAIACHDPKGIYARRAIDGDPETVWYSGHAAPAWIQLDLGSPYTVTGLRVLPERWDPIGGPSGTDTVQILFGDNSIPIVWTDGGTYQWDLTSNVWFSHGIYAENARYVKIVTQTSASFVAWREVEVHGAPLGGPASVGSNLMMLDLNHQSVLFSPDFYDQEYIEHALGIAAEMGHQWVRVFAGELLQNLAEPCDLDLAFRDGVRENLVDFFSRARTHGLGVVIGFGWPDDWMIRYYDSCAPHAPWVWMRTEYEEDGDFTDDDDCGRRIYAEKLRFVAEDLFAALPPDQPGLIIDLHNEPFVPFAENEWYPPWGAGHVEELPILAKKWTDYMYGVVRGADPNPNHMITVGLVQTNAYTEWLWAWPPMGTEEVPGIVTQTPIDIADMHYYHFDGTQTFQSEFDSLFAWAEGSPKPVIVGETGVTWGDGEQQASQWLTALLDEIDAQAHYEKVKSTMLWMMTPHHGMYVHADDQTFHSVTDGYNGFTRLGVSLRDRSFVQAGVTTDPPACDLGVPASAVNDDDEGTTCILPLVPTAEDPNVTTVDFQQWYRFHTIRVIDNMAPAPKDFDIEVFDGDWHLFAEKRGNPSSSPVVDAVFSPTDPYDWIAGYKVRITVFDEYANHSSLSEIKINPTIVLPSADFVFSAAIEPPAAGAPIQFTDTSWGSDRIWTSWEWDFGDPTQPQHSYVQNPTHVYANPGVYTVTFTASNDVGYDSVSKTVEVN